MSSALECHQSAMQQFYSGKTVLVTGATGFLGKALVEKLLHSCPGIRQLYLLVREKHGKTVEDRLKTLLDDVAFSRLRDCDPGFSERLAVVHGDLHSPRLGLDPSDEALLTQTVDIVIHSAATVRFDEKLKEAIATNVVATTELCSLALGMNHLKAFVYVSTAYSNCEQAVITERVSPPPVRPESLISFAQLLEDRVLDDITPSLLSSKQNTYIFTKCAAEQVISQFKSTLPVAILRPSIVLAAVSEPLPGWVDSVQGPTGVAVSVLAGLLRTVMCANHATANIVPVDYVANAIIALAYTVGSNSWRCPVGPKDDGVPVVNFVSLSSNSLTWAEYGELLLEGVRRYPSCRLLWYPTITTPQQPWVGALHATVLHRLPARVLDAVSAVFGKPTRLAKLYDRLDKYTKVIHYFANHHFEFEARNAALLWESLEPLDQQLFPFNMADIQWESYFSDYVRGCRQYLLTESPDTLPQARRRLGILYIFHILTKGAITVFSVKLIQFILILVRNKLVTSDIGHGIGVAVLDNLLF